MNLLYPTFGQLLDRASILQLKILHADPERRTYFAAEQQAIFAQVFPPDTHEPIRAARQRGYAQLQTINARIWHANVVLADLAQTPDPPPNQLALQMFRWNQERVALIEQIDREAGMTVVSEKVGY